MVKRKNPSRNNVRHLIAKQNPRSPISEQYRTIRTNLQFSSVDNEMKSILITSSGPAEGKSSTVGNLAIVFAQQGKKVLLIDGDLRKPTLHYTFRVDNRKGLSSVLIGENALEESITASDVPNLDLLSCGPIPPNPSELLGSKAMEKMLSHASELYDVILIDTPPVLAVTDAQILANLCDGALLVVRSKKTEKEAAQKARDLLMPAKAKLLGAILNDREQKHSSYYYYGTN
ncbi:CpsD/CapB family tyrosine-protein kinase [Aquibacillus sp. 3ASR75-11]|uniref:non-specific protein-tyrosine kinase n=1 Tax=Terrihalobacillus insolitus TaxID=2950438 RepID=A0A9X3WQP2_9BACI|nr:CpsD/CapB family tyrosine-protein kinase [Terrihalobacillus insolitus]MDC3423495.1 CpsD/CapB family tyrosine-protein kinase [Terrihalobacillus insolitus]